MRRDRTPEGKRDANGAMLIAIGMALGAALGAVFGDVAIGVAVGTGLGAAAYSLTAFRFGRG